MRKGGGLRECKSELERLREWKNLKWEEGREGGKGGRNRGGAGKRFTHTPFAESCNRYR